MFLFFSCTVVSHSLRPHGLQHPRLSCPSAPPGVAQTHVHWVSDAIQPSHSLSSPSPSAFNLTSPLTWACWPAYLEILEPWYLYTAILNYLLNHQPQIQNINPDCKPSSYPIIKGTDTSKHNEGFWHMIFCLNEEIRRGKTRSIENQSTG